MPTGGDQVLKRRKPLAHRRTDARHRDRVGEVEVPEQRPPNQPALVVETLDVGRHEHRHPVRPRDSAQDRPPATHDLRDEKAEDERDRD